MPYIAYWPGTIEAGSISDLMATGWDMMPTFVELLGEDTNWREEAMDGLSILPTLTGKGNNGNMTSCIGSSTRKTVAKP